MQQNFGPKMSSGAELNSLRMSFTGIIFSEHGSEYSGSLKARDILS
jgi:hypothetical protein